MVETETLKTPMSLAPSLPPLEHHDGAKLQKLTPVAVDIEWDHSAPSSRSRLLRIEHIEVVRAPSDAESAKNQEYVVQIFDYDRPASHIPTVIWSEHPHTTTSQPHRHPDHRVVHSVTQFCALRNIVHSCIPTDYQTSSCPSCRALGQFMRNGGGRPMAFAALPLNATTDASAMLSIFINYLVEACRSAPEPEEVASCRCEHHIAAVLHDFLFRA